MSLGSGTGLSSGAGGSLSSASVGTLIKQNTPWQTIEKISVGTASEVIFDEIADTWKTLLVNFDNISGSTNSWQLYMQVFVGNAASSSGSYAWTANNYQLTSQYFTGTAGASEYPIMIGHTADSNWTGTGDMIISGLEATYKPIFRSRFATGTSTLDNSLFDTSGAHSSTSQLTGLRFYLSTGNFDKGTIHLSGLN